VTVDIRDERFRAVVGSEVAFERLGTGFDFVEGPVWNPVEKHLIFSDMPGNRMRKWTQAGGVVSWRHPSNMANGNTYDRQGRLVTCEHATSRVTRTEPDGAITVLASHYEGKQLNSPNDVVVSRDGCVYFTDPTYGRMEYFGVPRECELGFQGLFRCDPGTGTLTLLADDFEQPNGLCFSADGARLFVSDTPRNHIRVFDVQDDGTVSGGRVWAELIGEGEGVPDGLKLDSAGHVYSCGPGGIHVFDPGAASLGVIRVPEHSANFCWGDEDMCSLFIAASTSLYRVRVKVPGCRLF
jgi:gluconolactonase